MLLVLDRETIAEIVKRKMEFRLRKKFLIRNWNQQGGLILVDELEDNSIQEALVQHYDTISSS